MSVVVSMTKGKLGFCIILECECLSSPVYEEWLISDNMVKILHWTYYHAQFSVKLNVNVKPGWVWICVLSKPVYINNIICTALVKTVVTICKFITSNGHNVQIKKK